MTEKELRQGLSACLSGAELSEERKRQVLAQMKGEEPVMKRKMSLAFVMIMALLVLTAATALAVGLTQGTVNWKGETVDDSDRVEALSTPEPGATMSPIPEDEAREARGLEILNTAQPGEFIVVEWPESGGRGYQGRSAHEKLDDPDTLADKYGLLPAPAWIPEGYVLATASVSYDAAQYELADSESDDYGLTVRRYRMVDPYVSGCWAIYQNAAGEQLSYRVELWENSDAMNFGLEGDDTVERLDVDGMDDALLFRKEALRLYMRRALDEAVPHQSVYDLFDTEGMTEEEKLPYSEIHVTIQASALSGEELAKVFTGE